MIQLFYALFFAFIMYFLTACGEDISTLDFNTSDSLTYTPTTFAQNSISELNNTEENETLSSFQVLSGRAIDGYLKEAYVCIDTNLDDSCLEEAYSTQTDDLGYYELALDDAIVDKIKSKHLPILVYGGVDSDSKKRYRGKLKAIVDQNISTHNITPITSVAFSAYSNGLTIQEAKLSTAKQLEIDLSDVDSDFIEEQNYKTKAVALSLQKSLEVLSKTDNDISLGYEKLGKQIVSSLTDANISSSSLIDFIATIDSSNEAIDMITLVNDISQEFSSQDVNQGNALALLNENLKVIKNIAENNDSELRNNLNTLIHAVVNNDFESATTSTYINKLLLSSLDVKDVDSLISKLNTSSLDLSQNASVTEIVDAINESNPGFIKATLTSVTEIVKTSTLALSKDFVSNTLTDLLTSDKNISSIFSPKAFLEFAVQDKSDLFFNVVTESNSLGKFFNEEANPLVLSALNISGLKLSDSTKQTLAKINISSITDQNSSTGILNFALNLLPKNTENNTSTQESNTSKFTFSGVLFDFVLDKISGETTLQDLALQQAVVVASKTLNLNLSTDDAKKFLELYKEKDNITIANLTSFYDLIKKFATNQTNNNEDI